MKGTTARFQRQMLTLLVDSFSPECGQEARKTVLSTLGISEKDWLNFFIHKGFLDLMARKHRSWKQAKQLLQNNQRSQLEQLMKTRFGDEKIVTIKAMRAYSRVIIFFYFLSIFFFTKNYTKTATPKHTSWRKFLQKKLFYHRI
jgi:hypothetical protein